LRLSNRADDVVLRLESPHVVPLRAPLLQLVLSENGASVDAVMIGGRIVFRDGKLLTLDETALRRGAEEAAGRLDESNADLFVWRGHCAPRRRILRGTGLRPAWPA
jgi:hypothetical protein